MAVPTPSNYDEAQERLEELRDKVGSASLELSYAMADLNGAQDRYDACRAEFSRAMKAFAEHANKITEEAAAEKAVRG